MAAWQGRAAAVQYIFQNPSSVAALAWHKYDAAWYLVYQQPGDCQRDSGQ